MTAQEAAERRLPDRCYLCGEPSFTEWFCVAHLWATSVPKEPPSANGLAKITHEHAFWIKRLTPQQIVDLAGYLGPAEAA
jgi:hypothetical protein